MTKAFILNLDVGDDTDFLTIAKEIQEDLESHGDYLVVSVAPWAGQNLGGSPPQPPVGQPQQQ